MVQYYSIKVKLQKSIKLRKFWQIIYFFIDFLLFFLFIYYFFYFTIYFILTPQRVIFKQTINNTKNNFSVQIYQKIVKKRRGKSPSFSFNQITHYA
jgi:hypothetical protein